ILEDDSHDVMRLWPEPAGFGPLWNAYMRSYDRLGNDPYVGHRLVSLLYEAGAAPRRKTWIFFRSCSGSPTLDPYVENLIGLLEGARATCIKAGFIDRTCFDQGIAALRAWKNRPDAALWFAISYAEGIRES